MGWDTETTWRPGGARPSTTKDVNGRVTDIDYDALGRPPRCGSRAGPKTGTANQKFAYGVTPYTPNWAKTSVLNPIERRNRHATSNSWTYYDGFGEHGRDPDRRTGRHRPDRHRQRATTTAACVAGPRPVLQHRRPRHWRGQPDPPRTSSRTRDRLRRLERPTQLGSTPRTAVPEMVDHHQLRRRPHHRHPAGRRHHHHGRDARGRTTSSIEQADTGTVTTLYGYNLRDELTRITDAKGNVTRYTYDLLGQRPTVRRPGRRHHQLHLQRRRPARRPPPMPEPRPRQRLRQPRPQDRPHEDSTSGTKLAKWTYDTLADGKVVRGGSPPHLLRSGKAYTQRVTGYDIDGSAHQQQVTFRPRKAPRRHLRLRRRL